MSTLLETYSHTSRLRIDKPVLMEHSMPLPFENPYILIITSTGMPAKNYGYYNRVTEFLHEDLVKAGTKIIQAGGPNDQRVLCDLDLCGKTTTYQYLWLIQNASLVLCGDTSAVHSAGAYNVPFVALYSITDPRISGAAFGDKNKQVYITPPDWKPTFLPNENPKTIDKILPETIVEAVLSSLNIQCSRSRETIRIGEHSNQELWDLIPNSVIAPNFLPQIPWNIRLDKGGEEQFVYHNLRVRKCHVFTDRPLDTTILEQLKPNIVKIFYIFGRDYSLDFVKKVQRLGIGVDLICSLPDEEIYSLKLDFCDYGVVHSYKEYFKQSDYRGPANAKFKTSRRILSGGKIYLSYAHEKSNLPVENMGPVEQNVIDSPEFWADSEYFYVYR